MPEIRYLFENKFVPEFGKPFQVLPELYWLRMPLPFVLTHVNVWLIKDTDGWCAVDTGSVSGEAKAIWENVLKDFPLQRVVGTHYHTDHMGLSGWLEKKTGAPLYCTRGEYLTGMAYQLQWRNYAIGAALALYAKHGMEQKIIDYMSNFGAAYSEKNFIIPETFRCLHEGEPVSIGGRKWEIIGGYGHSVEHVSLYSPELKVLVAGDMLLSSISTNIPVTSVNPEDDPLKGFLLSVRKYLKLPNDTLVLPSHGRPFYGIHERVASIEARHHERCEKVLAACREPKKAYELMPMLFEKEMVAPFQFYFAIGETVACLNCLRAEGRAERFEKDGFYYFRAV